MRPPAPAARAAKTVRRGEVWWVDLDPTQGAEIRKTRPCVIVSADGLNRVRRTVLIVPLSTGPEPRPPITVATPSFGEDSVAVCDQLRAVDRNRLKTKAANLGARDLRAIEAALVQVLGL